MMHMVNMYVRYVPFFFLQEKTCRLELARKHMAFDTLTEQLAVTLLVTISIVLKNCWGVEYNEIPAVASNNDFVAGTSKATEDDAEAAYKSAEILAPNIAGGTLYRRRSESINKSDEVETAEDSGDHFNY